ncbi:MAG: phosphonopyruvate decarboxylase [Limnospira sp. PMC 894.15]|uniref:Phosphonopyruvate decarboxylase n=1 Tax=Limnospira maxima CS-328 TaxID=513049 RepID=B5W6I1_LIMMA|nr:MULTISPECIES: phosphonopyruvate decarboxylase [Limnospira]MDC0838510.1 phosphonopyruvate decarboxylase [Limnoraphis robusta]EDZ92425.1 phosphonopyruvate decarboxylase [Limnospira maxima CS-328]EDZ92889.1 phosphonopyruvate decarboxylase [Limnospira maxima CS-328]MDT9190487.1 phosphonopyruvate decarboxylase [Limnospira sp. PMC 894.15]MDT9234648.1 phosphonopyruvate decarboxylase [Limnospira sp. PMC 917.15]
MIDPQAFYTTLCQAGVHLFAGVPDSLLKDFCAYIDDHSQPGEHIITANEGNAIALVAGYHLATNQIGAVYLQNSGLGNTINPLTSLTDPQVYQIPLVMIIGWRGEPGVKDEPQHIKQGAITPGQLDLLGVPYWIVDGHSDFQQIIQDALTQTQATNAPVALLVRKGTFSPYQKRQRPSSFKASLQREAALDELLTLVGDSLVVSTTGKTSRELFELRQQRGETQRDFLTVGSMGHTASIALGVALGNPRKSVVCIDGDGSLLMHLGAVPIIGSLAPKNLIHVVLNNAAHESVGGQPTVAGQLDLKAVALASGYKQYRQATEQPGIKQAWNELSGYDGPVLLEIRINTGSRENLGRPTSSPQQNKQAFMKVATDG